MNSLTYVRRRMMLRALGFRWKEEKAQWERQQIITDEQIDTVADEMWDAFLTIFPWGCRSWDALTVACMRRDMLLQQAREGGLIP